MKYIRNFDSLNSAKAATLYSPTLVKIKNNDETVLLNANAGEKDYKLKVKTDQAGNIYIGEIPLITFTIKDILNNQVVRIWQCSVPEGITWQQLYDNKENYPGTYIEGSGDGNPIIIGSNWVEIPAYTKDTKAIQWEQSNNAIIANKCYEASEEGTG